MPNRAAIYTRVSSEGDRQNTDRQVVDLQAYAAAAGLEIVRVFTEKASGAWDDRPSFHCKRKWRVTTFEGKVR